MSNYKHVKKYELKQKERGLKRQKVWIPDTPEARKELLKFGEQLRTAHLKKLGIE